MKISKEVKIFIAALIVIGFIGSLIVYKPGMIDQECCDTFCERVSQQGKCLMKTKTQIICGLDYSAYGAVGVYEKVAFEVQRPDKTCGGFKNEESMGQNSTGQSEENRTTE